MNIKHNWLYTRPTNCQHGIRNLSKKTELCRKNSGFSLIELIIVVAIIGILASVAVPNYRNYVLKAKMTEAVNLLSEIQLAMINYHMEHGEFVENLSDLNQRNLEVGLEGRHGYASEIIDQVWVGRMGVVGQPETSAHIAMMFQTGHGLADNGQPRMLSTIEFTRGTYRFICADNASTYGAGWNSIKQQLLPASCRHD